MKSNQSCWQQKNRDFWIFKKFENSAHQILSRNQWFPHRTIFGDDQKEIQKIPGEIVTHTRDRAKTKFQFQANRVEMACVCLFMAPLDTRYVTDFLQMSSIHQIWHSLESSVCVFWGVELWGLDESSNSSKSVNRQFCFFSCFSIEKLKVNIEIRDEESCKTNR